MKNGWKKMPINHGSEKMTRIQTKHLVLLGIKVSTYMYTVMGKSAFLSHMKDKKHKEYVKIFKAMRRPQKHRC